MLDVCLSSSTLSEDPGLPLLPLLLPPCATTCHHMPPYATMPIPCFAGGSDSSRLQGHSQRRARARGDATLCDCRTLGGVTEVSWRCHISETAVTKGIVPPIIASCYIRAAPHTHLRISDSSGGAA